MLEMQFLDSDRLFEISQAWEKTAGSDEFASELAAIFAGVEVDLERPGAGIAKWAELRDPDDTSECAALIEIIDTKRGEMTKMLTLHFSPQFWPNGAYTDEADRVERVTEVYAGAIAEVLSYGKKRANDGIHDVKIFGRGEQLYSILKHLCTNWSRLKQNSEAVMEGRWLRVSL